MDSVGVNLPANDAPEWGMVHRALGQQLTKLDSAINNLANYLSCCRAVSRQPAARSALVSHVHALCPVEIDAAGVVAVVDEFVARLPVSALPAVAHAQSVVHAVEQTAIGVSNGAPPATGTTVGQVVRVVLLLVVIWTALRFLL